MIHKIKLRKSQRSEPVICPYAVSGICHRDGCIYLPPMSCMTEREYRNRLKYAKKGRKK